MKPGETVNGRQRVNSGNGHDQADRRGDDRLPWRDYRVRGRARQGASQTRVRPAELASQAVKCNER